jgi:hypothetical protein
MLGACGGERVVAGGTGLHPHCHQFERLLTLAELCCGQGAVARGGFEREPGTCGLRGDAGAQAFLRVAAGCQQVACRPLRTPEAAGEVDLVAHGQAATVAGVGERLARLHGLLALRGEPAAGGREAQVHARDERGAGHGQIRARLAHTLGGEPHIGVVGERFFNQAVERGVVETGPPALECG